MDTIKLKKDGTLYKSDKPAIYADTDFLRSYFFAQGAERAVDEEGNWIEEELKRNEEIVGKDETGKYLRKLVKAEKKYREMAYIRHLNIYGLTQVSFIMTPIGLLELSKIHTEILFKNICADKMNAKHIQQWGDRQVGEYLTELLTDYENDKNNETLRYLFLDTRFNLAFASKVLHAISYVPDLKLRITHKDYMDFLWVLSYLQLGPVDMLHLQAAKQLNCDYFASFDSRFKGNKELILKRSGIQVLPDAKAIIDILKQHPNKKKIPRV